MSTLGEVEGLIDFQSVFGAYPDGVVIVDGSGAVCAVNPAAQGMFGYSSEELLGQPVEVLVPEAVRGGHAGHREAFAADPRPRPMGIDMELEGRRRDGSVFPVEISLSTMHGEVGLLVIATVRGVSARKRLRSFGVSALDAAESERQRIARELHDDTAQHLAALQLRVRAAARSTGVPAVTELLEELRGELHGCAEGVRRIARGLRPPALAEAGLTSAILALTDPSGDPDAMRVEVRADRGDPKLSDEQKLAAYRIIQEALTNARRHSGADNATVVLRWADGRFNAIVEDDGRGFDVEGVRQTGEGLGIIGMYERARAAGGRVRIDSTPGGGARITLDLPSA